MMQVSLAELFAQVDIDEAVVVAFIENGCIAEDSLPILHDAECRNWKQPFTNETNPDVGCRVTSSAQGFEDNILV